MQNPAAKLQSLLLPSRRLLQRCADACRNCMPKRDDSGDMQCWSIDKPVTYKLHRYGKVRPEGRGTAAQISRWICAAVCEEVTLWQLTCQLQQIAVSLRGAFAMLDHPCLPAACSFVDSIICKLASVL